MVFGFNNRDKGYGFGPMPGINRKKRGTLAKGNWDRDPKPNRTDCQPFNFKKQDAYTKDVDDENRRMRKKLKFEGDKKTLKAMKKENQEEYFQDGNDYTYY